MRDDVAECFGFGQFLCRHAPGSGFCSLRGFLRSGGGFGRGFTGCVTGSGLSLRRIIVGPLRRFPRLCRKIFSFLDERVFVFFLLHPCQRSGFARPGDVDGGQADKERERRDDFKIDERFNPDAPDLFNVAGAGDADDER